MANPRHSRPVRRRAAVQDLEFRVLSPWKTLDEQGFYEGTPCHRGHSIRDKEKHWCYHCVQMIQSGICGVDFNYMEYQYRTKLYHFLNEVLEESGMTVANTAKCWLPRAESGWPRKTVNYDSWKTHFHAKGHDYREKLPKVMYTLFHGDIGKMSVTRTCGNKQCLNPLHLTSSWNFLHLPTKFDYLHLELDQSKMSTFDARNALGIRVNKLLVESHRIKIKASAEIVQETDETPDPLLKTIDWNTLKNNQS
jgi:hypothetical protein